MLLGICLLILSGLITYGLKEWCHLLARIRNGDRKPWPLPLNVSMFTTSVKTSYNIEKGYGLTIAHSILRATVGGECYIASLTLSVAVKFRIIETIYWQGFICTFRTSWTLDTDEFVRGII